MRANLEQEQERRVNIREKTSTRRSSGAYRSEITRRLHADTLKFSTTSVKLFSHKNNCAGIFNQFIILWKVEIYSWAPYKFKNSSSDFIPFTYPL